MPRRRALPPGGPYHDRWELGYARCRAVAALLAEHKVHKIEPERFRLSVVPAIDAGSTDATRAEADNAVRVNLGATMLSGMRSPPDSFAAPAEGPAK